MGVLFSTKYTRLFGRLDVEGHGAVGFDAFVNGPDEEKTKRTPITFNLARIPQHLDEIVFVCYAIRRI